MGWAVGYDPNWNRDVGYGVPSLCDHPDCGEEIDRGLLYVCGGDIYGGEHGCGLFFCSAHLGYLIDDHGHIEGPQRCERCLEDEDVSPFEPKSDVAEWINHKLTHDSWQRWRDENPAEVIALRVLTAADGAS